MELWARTAEVIEVLLGGARSVESRLTLGWEPERWSGVALRRLQTLPTTVRSDFFPSRGNDTDAMCPCVQGPGFEVTERLLSVMLALSTTEAVSPALTLDDRRSLTVAVSKVRSAPLPERAAADETVLSSSTSCKGHRRPSMSRLSISSGGYSSSPDIDTLKPSSPAD